MTLAPNVPPEALFLDYQEEDGSVSTVEVFTRADGSTHVTAFSDIVPLPLDPATVTPDPDAIERLKAICERLSPVFRADRIIARQACFPSGDGGWATANGQSTAARRSLCCHRP